MGIIKAVGQAVKFGIADLWAETIEPDNMGEHTILTPGIKVRRGQNVNGTDNFVSNGSIIRVYENQFMMLVDGGKIVDYTAEPGYYEVKNSSAPSMLNGEFGDTLKEVFKRVKFGGETPREQKVYYLNLQEIKGIKFGTRNPMGYYDSFYNAELFLRAHGSYSIKITNPLQFYSEVIPKNKDYVEIEDINEHYEFEFLTGLQSAISQMSADGIHIFHVTSKTRELSKYMSDILDEEWNELRGMEIKSVGIASVSYDDNSRKMIDLRNEGAMLSDPSVREGYVQAAMARGLEAAGSNSSGATTGFLGMGMGMNMSGAVMGQSSATNLAQMKMQQAQMQQAQMQQAPMQSSRPQPASGATWTCGCGNVNTGKFCSECGSPAPSKEWTCSCGQVNSGKFCSECGKPRA